MGESKNILVYLSSTTKLKLTKQQVRYLKLIFKFRFITVQLLASYIGVNRSAVQRSLVTLLERGYITRRYNTDYRMSGRYAEYCLDLAGIRYLRESMTDNWPDELFKPMYKDRTCTDDFVQKCLAILKTYIRLNEQYGSGVVMLTGSELRRREDCPKPLPSLYVYSTKLEDKDWFIEVITNPLFFFIKKRVQQYVAHYEEYEWEGDTYPRVVLLVPNEKLQKKTTRYVKNYLEEKYIDNDEISVVATFTETIVLSITTG